MDATAEVGLGYDNKDQQAMLMQSMVMAVQAEIAKAQGGLEGPVVTWKHIYASATKATEVAGFNLPERFFQDPESQEGQQAIEGMKNRPDPKMAEVQGKLQAQQAKDQADDQRQQKKAAAEDARDRQKMFLDFQLKQMEMGMEFNIERSKMMFNASLDVMDQKRQAAADRASISANGDVK
jgi:Skp family chaperone for outer membrane proteins